MEAIERQYFEMLKNKIVEVMQKNNAGIGRNIADWKGQDIIEFQDDLQMKINEYISEKWFYIHIKTYNEKLPRIDVLNILSRYTGYVDWSEFKFKNRDQVIMITEHKGSNKIFYILPAIALVIFLLAWLIIKTGSVATYKFCFIDKDTKEPIKNSQIEVIQLFDDQSPLSQFCDREGCFTLKTGRQKVRFLVNAPYYFPDTITRILNKGRRNENVQLKVNDYALMIYYFSNSKVNDWNKRRENMDKIIADSAYICQVFNRGMIGMELYNKKEFIDMLTVPTSNLRNIEIIEMLYTDNKITTIRFIQDLNTK